MGLDIYLYTKAEQEYSDARDAEEKEFYGGADWPLYDSKSSAEKKEFETNRQYKEWRGNSDVPSRKYPGISTLNNRRYLRSSYNGAGFNSFVPNAVGHSATYEWMFSDVIDVANGEYDKWLTEADLPGLKVAQERAEQVATELYKLPVALNVTTLSSNPFSPPATTKEEHATTWVREQMKKESEYPFEGGWSNLEGNYYGHKNALKVVGVVYGVDWTGRPAVHMVYEIPDDTKIHYIQSATIAAEFAEEARELIEKDGSAYIYWSG